MKVPTGGLPLACCWLALVVTTTLARPQKLNLTPREFRAFKTVLGNKRALSITSAIPVMAFSDKNPTKYVQLPLEQVGGQTGHPSPAELLDTTSEEFGKAYGRGAGSSGPAFGASGKGKYQGVIDFNAADLQRGSDFDSSAGGDGGAFGPNKIVPLTYGFKPIFGPVGHSQSIGSNKAAGGLVHDSISPSKQLGQGALGSIGSIDGDDDLDLGGRKPHLASGENLFRHHVGSSLIPTTGGSPVSKAVGKLLKSQENVLDESDVVARSVDGRSILNQLLKEANGNKFIDVSGGALQSSAAVGASIKVRGSSKGELQSFKEEKSSLDHPELASAGFVSDSGAIVVRGGDSKSGDRSLPDPSASIFDSSRIEASSIFARNSVRLPQLPNVQLPLQTQEARSFEGQELPLETSHSTFTGNQQQVKLITEASNSQKRQVPQIPNSVKPAAKNLATASTESLLRLLRSQTKSESEDSTDQGKFTREISPQARQIPGAIPPGFRPIPATPRQNSRRSASPSVEQTRSKIRFENAASQQVQRAQATQTQQAPSTRSVEQPRTNNQFGRSVSHQSQQQFHPHFSPGPFSANPQVNSANQLLKLQQRQQQQEQEQKQREQEQAKRRDQLKEQQVLQQLAERQQKQEQRQQQQSQQQREQQQRQQQEQQRQQQQQQQLQQQQRQQQQQQPQQQQQQRQQQRQQVQQQLHQQNQQRHQQQQQNHQQSLRLGTKVTSGQPQTLEEFLAGGNTKPSTQFQQRPRPAQATIPGKVSQQSGLQQTQTIVTTKSNAQQPSLQLSKATQTLASGLHQLGTPVAKATSDSNQVRLQQSQSGTSNSASSSHQSQQLRIVQTPTSSAQVVSKQQVQAKPQQSVVQTSVVQQAKTPSAQSLPSTTSPGGTTVISASADSSLGSLPPSALQALGALGGGAAGGAQPHIVVKTLSLDAKDADPNSDAFKKALAEATKQARLELGVRDSEELGVASGDLASLFGKRRRKRQLFGGADASNAQTVGNALSTGAGLFDEDVDNADEEFE